MEGVNALDDGMRFELHRVITVYETLLQLTLQREYSAVYFI